MPNLSSGKKILFTPGPLNTSSNVKQAMLRDLGSRDIEFISIVGDIRKRLLEVSGLPAPDYECILMQGSGTFCIESVVGSTVPLEGKLLILVNGAYGRRIVQIARVLKIAHTVLEYAEDTPTDTQTVERTLKGDPSITNIAMIHSETTSGLVNNIAAIGALAKRHKKRFLVDAMSSFGGIVTNWHEANIDYVVSSANKCIEGVPGFGFILARRTALLEIEGKARSVSLDLYAQWKGLSGDGQFRFTPPTHALLAFQQALRELEFEGGVRARAARYQLNYETLVEAMRALGFREYLPPKVQGHIIVSFYYPDDPHFDFDEFYARLNDTGFVIYPGKVGNANCFRIGCIGQLFPDDMRALTEAIRATLQEMQIEMIPAEG